MGLCSSSERDNKAPKVIRIVSYKIIPGKEAELRAKTESISSDLSANASLALIAITPTELVFVAVCDTDPAMDAYTKANESNLAAVKEFVESTPLISERGTQFYRAYKPVSKGGFLRIVTFPGGEQTKVREIANTYRKSKCGGKIPGYEGGAYAENKKGFVFGYQAFDNKNNCEAYNTGVMEACADAGLSGAEVKHSEGEVISACAKASLFDSLPLGKDIREATGAVFDTTENVFQNLPGGQYVVDGVTYTVDKATASGEEIYTVTASGVSTTYQVGTDGVKLVPGADVVVNAGEQGFAMGKDAATQGMNATNNVTQDLANQGKGYATQGADMAMSGVKAVPGVNEAAAAGQAGLDQAKNVSNQANGYVKQGVDTTAGAVKAVPGVNEAAAAGQAGLSAAEGAAAAGKETSRSCF